MSTVVIVFLYITSSCMRRKAHSYYVNYCLSRLYYVTGIVLTTLEAFRPYNSLTI